MTSGALSPVSAAARQGSLSLAALARPIPSFAVLPAAKRAFAGPTSPDVNLPCQLGPAVLWALPGQPFSEDEMDYSSIIMDALVGTAVVAAVVGGAVGALLVWIF